MKYKKVFDAKEATHDQWLAFRRTGIGGSDMAAILGLNHWRSVLDVWLDKTGRAEPEAEQSEFAYWGTRHEPMVADEFQIRTNMKVRRCNYTLQSIENPFMLANIDREIVGALEGLECKTASAYKAEEWKADAVPDAYYIQCQHYMAVTGWDRWWIACLIGGNHFEHKPISRNNKVIDIIIQRAAEFWECVKNDTMPVVDGSNACAEAVKGIFSQPTGGTIELQETAKIYIEAYQKAKADEDDAKYRKQEAQNQLCMLLGNNETGNLGQYTVKWTATKGRTTFDTKKFTKDYPELAVKYTKTGEPTRRFSLKG